LFGQILPTKHDQDKVLDDTTKVLEHKKSLTTREEWQSRIPRTIAVDPSTDFSTSCRDTSCKEESTLVAAEGLFG